MLEPLSIMASAALALHGVPPMSSALTLCHRAIEILTAAMIAVGEAVADAVIDVICVHGDVT